MSWSLASCVMRLACWVTGAAIGIDHGNSGDLSSRGAARSQWHPLVPPFESRVVDEVPAPRTGWADRPAVLKGTVNDATDFPSPSKSHGSYHWAFERLLSASLIPVMGAAAVSSGSAYVSVPSFIMTTHWTLDRMASC